MAVPLLDLQRQYVQIRDAVDREIAEVVQSQHFILGPKVEAFEVAVRAFVGCGDAVGMSSGTDAQLAILMALNVGQGDAVITTPYTFFATVGCIHRVGAEAVFADIDPATFNLDPARLYELIDSKLACDVDGVLRTRRGNRVRAIIPVHLFGMCAEMDAIVRFAEEYKLTVIEDAAQAIGAECPIGGKTLRAGSIAPFAFFSFFPAKNLGAYGDAGLATCSDAVMGERLRLVRNHGMQRRYYHDMVGGNFRIDALQAAVLSAKLPFVDTWNQRRRDNAARYDAMFRDVGLEGVISWPAPVSPSDIPNRHIFHQYVVRTPRRDELLAHLSSKGIGHGVYYPIPLHMQECFAYLGYREGDFPESERAARETVALPIFPELRGEEIAEVVEAVRSFW